MEKALRTRDAVAMIVGVVVGAGIFRTPGLVAAGADGTTQLLGLWIAGGAVSLIGALCYAELATAFPSPGGEYHFLTRAFGRNLAFFFAWARLTVIPTGSIALLSFVFGDYATELLPLGPASNAIYAAVVVAGLTAVNVLGLRFGKVVQNVFTAFVVLGILVITVLGLSRGEAAPAVTVAPGTGVGLAMVFVLLTYGGWNEAAYLSSEIRGGRRNIAVSLVLGVLVVTALYVLVNVAYLRSLGMEGLRGAPTVAAEMMRRVLGQWGAVLVSGLIATAALTSVNATIVMGSRTGFALGRDFQVFRALGHWDPRANAPVPALLLQGLLALALVAVGALSRRGFETMVEYTAPVFWAFFLLTGIALIVLRSREPDADRPFRVPLYPLTPLLFCATCAYLLYSSIAYTRAGALLGVVVLAFGVVPMWLERTRVKEEAA